MKEMREEKMRGKGKKRREELYKIKLIRNNYFDQKRQTDFFDQKKRDCLFFDKNRWII